MLHAALLAEQQRHAEEQFKMKATVQKMEFKDALKLALEHVQNCVLSTTFVRPCDNMEGVACLERLVSKLQYLEKATISAKWPDAFVRLIDHSALCEIKSAQRSAGTNRCDVCNTKENGQRAVEFVFNLIGITFTTTRVGDLTRHSKIELRKVQNLVQSALGKRNEKKELGDYEKGRLRVGTTCLALTVAHWLSVHMLSRFVTNIVAQNTMLSDEAMKCEAEDMCNSISQIEEVLMRGHEENTKYSTTPEVPDIEYYDYEEDLKKGIHKLRNRVTDNNSTALETLLELRGKQSLGDSEHADVLPRRACKRDGSTKRDEDVEDEDGYDLDDGFINDEDEEEEEEDDDSFEDEDESEEEEEAPRKCGRNARKSMPPSKKAKTSRKSRLSKRAAPSNKIILDDGDDDDDDDEEDEFEVRGSPQARKNRKRKVIDDEDVPEDHQPEMQPPQEPSQQSSAGPSTSTIATNKPYDPLAELMDLQSALLRKGEQELAQKTFHIASHFASFTRGCTRENI